MPSRSEFWLTLHKLSHEIEQEGDTHQERAERLCEELGTVSAATRQVYLANLNDVIEALTEISFQCGPDGFIWPGDD
jgi:hypothetical protein